MRSQMPVSTRGSASLANPGSTPFTQSETPPASAARQRGGHRVAVRRVLQEHRARGDHVDAGPQEALQVGQGLHQAVVGHGRVHDAVGPQGQQRRRRRRWPPPPAAAQAGQLAGAGPTLSGLRRRAPPARGRAGRRCRRGRGGPRCRCSTPPLAGIGPPLSLIVCGGRSTRRAHRSGSPKSRFGTVGAAVGLEHLAGDEDPAGEARKRTAAAISAGSPIRRERGGLLHRRRSSSLCMTRSRAEVAASPRRWR